MRAALARLKRGLPAAYAGDADTIGAVTGALAGARYGIDAIPERWTAPLWDRDEMIRLTGQVFGWTNQIEAV